MTEPNRPAGGRPQLAAVLADQRARWRGGDRRRVEAYLELESQLGDDADAVLDLVGNEVILRQEIGEVPELGEYVQRFPHLAESLRLHFEVERALAAESFGLDTPFPASTGPPGSAGRAGADPAGTPSVSGFEILGVLGRGGMGVVYKARQASLKRTVALKMVLAGAHAGAHELRRFRAEAEAVAGLQHANIVAIYEVGEQHGLPYLALEYLDGGTLAQRFAGGTLAARDAATLVETLARATHWAHQNGTVHRDLKPANILLTSAGVPKIADFGLAKRLALESADGATCSGAVIGTPNYMAPEQAAGDSKLVGPAADVYALGAILYEAVTGRPPLKADTAIEILQRVLTEEPAPPRQLRPGLPRDLETICLKCLRKEAGRRYAGAGELADDLRRFLDDETIRARPAGPWDRGRKWVRRHPARALIGLLAIVLLFGIGTGYAQWRQKERHRIGGDEARKRYEERERDEAAQNEVRVELFANVARRWGIPEGIGPITPVDAQRRHLTYRITRRGGRVEKVETINGRGTPVGSAELAPFLSPIGRGMGVAELTSRECSVELRYDANGQPSEQVGKDPNGNTVWTFHYSKSPTTGHFLDDRNFVRPVTSAGSAYVEARFSAEGFADEIHFFDRSGRPAHDKFGYFGRRQQFDSRGLATRETFLAKPNARGEYADALGAADLAYDGAGNLMRMTFRGADGAATLVNQGYAVVAHEFDAHGNRRETRFFGVDGTPALKTDGYAGLTNRYDDYGNLAAVEFFGLDGLPTLTNLGCAKVVMKHDDRGRVTQRANFGADGQAVVAHDGYSILDMTYDERGNVKEQRYRGVDGRPVSVDGFAKVVYRYDERDRRTEEAYFGPDDRSVLRDNSYGIMRLSHDASGRLIGKAYFDGDGRPILTREGFARFDWLLDDNGNVRECHFFGLDGKPICHRDGYAYYAVRYDDRGNFMEQINFGLDHRRALDARQNWSRWVARYDGNDNLIEEAFFGIDDKPVMSSHGGARFTSDRDARGNVTRFSAFDIDGRPLLQPEGWATRTLAFNARDQVIEEAYFDTGGRPVVPKGSRCARAVLEIDDHTGAVLERNYFDVAGKPMPTRATIIRIDPGSPAERVGLKAGDSLISFDGRPIPKCAVFVKTWKSESQHHYTRELRVLRGGNVMLFQIAPGTPGITLDDVLP